MECVVDCATLVLLIMVTTDVTTTIMKLIMVDEIIYCIPNIT